MNRPDKRSDTILLVRIDPVAGTVKMLSFPRDLWVPIADTGQNDRINAAYGRGRQVLVDTIRKDFGVDVNNYIEVDFRGFKGLVDALGGVPMYFDTAMRDSNTGLNITQPGCVTLNGDEALAFARSRHLQFKDGARPLGGRPDRRPRPHHAPADLRADGAAQGVVAWVCSRTRRRSSTCSTWRPTASPSTRPSTAAI